MNIEYMKEYLVLANNLNFSLSADLLFTTQSTLSRHIQTLEKELAVPLLSRNTHQVQLTEQGRKVASAFQKIVQTYDQLTEELRFGKAKKIRFDIPYYALEKYVIPILKSFRETFPDIEVELLSHQPKEILNNVLSEKVDAGLLMANKNAEHSILKNHWIGSEKFILMLPQNHALACKQHLSIASLQNQTLILMADHDFFNIPLLACLEENHITPSSIIYANQVDTLTLTVEENCGVSVIPAHLAVMKRKGILLSALDNLNLSVDFYITVRKDNYNPYLPLLIQCAKKIIY